MSKLGAMSVGAQSASKEVADGCCQAQTLRLPLCDLSVVVVYDTGTYGSFDVCIRVVLFYLGHLRCQSLKVSNMAQPKKRGFSISLA